MYCLLGWKPQIWGRKVNDKVRLFVLCCITAINLHSEMVEMSSHWSRRGSEIVLPVCVCGGSCGLSGLHAAVQGGAEARGRPRDGDVWGWSATQLAAPLCWHAVGRRTGHLSGCHGRRQRAAWASASWWVPSSVSVHKQGGFYPRARVLAKALCLCLTVCLSVTSRCCVEVVGRFQLVFGAEASFDQSYTVF